ncbi:MAG: hypothetical protein GY715_04010 [Planctomycetes bacterium]|nr:hypothetical protein [Planctomycetota bacterium]
MSAETDLTRWNRSGLARFRYVDGNAATFLEIVRDALARQPVFDRWQAGSAPSGPESRAERKERLEEQYGGSTGDWGWELGRTLARAVHVLTEHIDADANEGYLETATQWENLRRLVEMIDYHPTPPASAFTSLVLKTPDGQSGTLTTGFAVRHTPDDGSAPIVFETLEDLDVDAALNGLRLRDWDRNPEPYRSLPPTAQALVWTIDADAVISVGDRGLIANERTRETAIVTVADVDDAERTPRTVRLGDAEGATDWRGWALGDITLHVVPKQVAVPRMNGRDVLTCAAPHGFSVGEVIAWESGSHWRFNRVTEADETSMRLARPTVPSDGQDVYRASCVARSAEGALSFTTAVSGVGYETGGALAELPPGYYTKVTYTDTDVTSSVHKVSHESVHEVFVVHGGLMPQATVAKDTEGGYLFDGAPGDLQSGDWVVADGPLGLRPRIVVNVHELESTHRVRLGVPSGQTLPDDFPVANRDVVDIQGIGRRRADAMRDAGISSIRDLAELAPPIVKNIPATWVRELRTKARLLLEQREKLARLAGLWTFTLDRVVGMSVENLALITGLAPDQAADVIATVRLIEALLDQEAFRTIRLGDFAEGDTEAGTTDTADVMHRLYGPFEHTLSPRDHDRNPASVDGRVLTIDLDPDAGLPATLAVGRSVIVEREVAEGACEGAALCSLVEVDDTRGTLTLSEPLSAADGFTLGNTVIRANVVRAGHGETRKERVLGSGDATVNNQRLRFEVADVSFVADASQTAGVRAAIDVRVDGQTWQQVSSLRNSRATDAAYTVRMTADGHLLLEFGDGTHGRRLPAGPNNVRILHREGVGLIGNLDPNGLTKAVRPDPLVESVRQPLASSGGAAMESAASLRQNAPSSLLTLERAVSIADFGHLAASQSSVWQARAFHQKAAIGRHETVEVVVVPAGGGELGALAGTIGDFLRSHALPGVNVLVSPYERVEIDLAGAVRIKSNEYEPEHVLAAVRDALVASLSLERRELGAPLYRSEVYAIVEAVAGVENCLCRIVAARHTGATTREAGRPDLPRDIPVAERRTQEIQGIGEIASSGTGRTYADWLADRGVSSIGALADFDPRTVDLDAGVSFAVAPARLWEFRVKARSLISLGESLGALAAVPGITLREADAMSEETLGDQLGLSAERVAEIQRAVRMAEIFLDQSAFRTMRAAEFARGAVPSLAPGAFGGYPITRLGVDGVIRSVWPSDRQVAFFDPERCRLDLTWEEYEL